MSYLMSTRSWILAHLSPIRVIMLNIIDKMTCLMIMLITWPLLHHKVRNLSWICIWKNLQKTQKLIWTYWNFGRPHLWVIQNLQVRLEISLTSLCLFSCLRVCIQYWKKGDNSLSKFTESRNSGGFSVFARLGAREGHRTVHVLIFRLIHVLSLTLSHHMF